MAKSDENRTPSVPMPVEKDALEQLKAVIANIYGGVSVAVYGNDGTFRLVYANDSYYSIFGYSREQFNSELHSPHDTLLYEDAEYAASMIEQVKSTGVPSSFKFRAKTRDGKRIVLRCNVSISSIAGLGERVMISILTDITSSEDAEQQALVNGQRLDAIMRNINSGIAAGIMESDGNMKYIFVSDRYYELFGYTREQYHIEVTDFFSLIYGTDPEKVRAAAAALREVGETKKLRFQARRRDGKVIWLSVDISIMQFADVDSPVQLSVFTDITSAVENEDTLRVNDELLRIAAETDKRTLITYDIKTNSVHIGSPNLFSAKYGEVIDNIPDSILDRGIAAPESTDEVCALFARIRAGEPHITTSLRLHTDLHDYQWFECSSTLVFDSEGKADKAVLVFHNITEQLLKEAVFKRWQKSIDTRPKESFTLFRCNLSKETSLDKRDGTLLKVDFSKQAMTFNDRTREYAEKYVYPDDREAYTALLNSDSLLAMFYRDEHEASLEYREINGSELRWRLLTVELVEYLNSTDVQAFLMYEDIDEKKNEELAAKEMSESDPLTGAVNRAAFSEKVDRVLAAEASRTHALLMLDIDGFKLLNDTFGHIAGDQALIDIVAALRSIIREGDLVCRLGGDEFLILLHDMPYDAATEKRAKQMCDSVRKAFSQQVQISASIGIAVYPRDGRNFDELYRSADSALYKVKNSGKDNFAFFSDVDNSAEAEVPDNAVGAVELAKVKRRMLIVDDDELNREILSSIFRDEYQIETAKNGSDAMIRLRHFGSALSVVLLDLIMPGMDGFEVLQRMQNNVEMKAIPVIVVSADSDDETSLRAIECGAADYVTKPVDERLIRIRVRSAVSKAENERLRAQNSYLQLQRAEEVKFHTVLESTGTVVVEYDWRNHVFFYDNTISKYIAGIYNNRGLWKIFLSDMVADIDDVKLMQNTLFSLANDRDNNRESLLVMLKTPEWVKHWFRVNIYKQVDDFGLAEKMIITFNDVHEEVVANEKLLFQATRDELTGLYNRSGFIEAAAKLIESKEAGYYVLSSLDIEKFKVINDQYGTERGDEVLRSVADGLLALLNKAQGICCRIMADNFAILYPAELLSSEENLTANHASEKLDGTLPPIKICVGRCLVDDKSLSVSAIYDRAAMAKNTVKGRYDEYIATYNESMRTELLRQQKIIGQMKNSLANGEFEVWFQPQYDHPSATLSGAEALVRWRNPEEGLISPAEFIPIFEKNGFVYEVDKFVWEFACKKLRQWLDSGTDPVSISVNISRYDVFRDDFFDTITGLVQKYAIPVALLRLEITESAFSDSAEQIIEMVKRLIVYGFTVEIDDFGSGFSSLNTLKDVPAQVLKMDMRFFENSSNSQRGGNIIESVVRMAKWLGMSVIAEGVEERAQADYLGSVGCSYIQGYYYAKPMPEADYEKLLFGSRKAASLKPLETLETLDNNEFWNPLSMETLVFNSYVGGACVFELHNGKTELLRRNSEFEQLFSGSFAIDRNEKDIPVIRYLDEAGKIALRENTLAAIADKNASSCEVCLISDCGEKKYLRVTVRLIAQAGDRYLLYSVLYDITDRCTAQQKEAETLDKLRTVMEHAGNGITAITMKGGKPELLFSNDRFFEIVGYSPKAYEQLTRDDVFAVVHEEDRARVGGMVMGLRQDGEQISVDYRVNRQDGMTVWLRAVVTLTTLTGVNEPVQIAVFSDITDEKEANAQLRFLNDSARDILAQPDSEQAIVGTLKKLIDYFAAERSYVVELDYQTMLSKNTYEVCAENAASQMAQLQEVIFGENDFWYASLIQKKIFNLEDVNSLGEDQSELRDMLSSQDIRSIILAPLWRDGELIGFAGVDNPQKSVRQIDRLSALSDYIAVLLTRRDLSRKISRDAETMREIPIRLLDNLPHGAALYRFDGEKLTVIHINRRYWELVERDAVDYADASVFGVIHPDDREAAYREIVSAIAEGRSAAVVLRILCGKADYKCFQVYANISIEPSGTYLLYVSYTPTER